MVHEDRRGGFGESSPHEQQPWRDEQEPFDQVFERPMHELPPPDRLFARHAIAAYMGITSRALNAIIDSIGLQGQRVGKRVLFPVTAQLVDAVEEWQALPVVETDGDDAGYAVVNGRTYGVPSVIAARVGRGKEFIVRGVDNGRLQGVSVIPGKVRNRDGTPGRVERLYCLEDIEHALRSERPPRRS